MVLESPRTSTTTSLVAPVRPAAWLKVRPGACEKAWRISFMTARESVLSCSLTKKLRFSGAPVLPTVVRMSVTEGCWRRISSMRVASACEAASGVPAGSLTCIVNWCWSMVGTKLKVRKVAA